MDNSTIKRLRWLSATTAICWLVLGSVLIVIGPHLIVPWIVGYWFPIFAHMKRLPAWLWALSSFSIGLCCLFQESWGAPRWVNWVLLILGGFLWGYLIVAGFILPSFNLPAPLVGY